MFFTCSSMHSYDLKVIFISVFCISFINISFILFVFIQIPAPFFSMNFALSSSCPGIGFIIIIGKQEFIHSVVVSPPGFVIANVETFISFGISFENPITLTLSVELSFSAILSNFFLISSFFPEITIIWYLFFKLFMNALKISDVVFCVNPYSPPPKNSKISFCSSKLNSFVTSSLLYFLKNLLEIGIPVA